MIQEIERTTWHSVENLLWKRLHVDTYVRPVYVATSGNLVACQLQSFLETDTTT